MQLSSMRQIILPQKAIEQIQLRIIFVFILYSPCFIHSKRISNSGRCRRKTIKFFKRIFMYSNEASFFGGGIAIVPTADASKPVIDFVVVERINFFKILWLILLLIQKKQLKSKYFHHYTTNRLRIVSTTPQHGQEDGEEMEKRPFDITITTTKQLFWC